MSNIYFAQPRHYYQSYADFWKLVELSGFPVIYHDEINNLKRDDLVIFTPINGDNAAGWPNAACTIILYDLEFHIPLDGVGQYDTNIKPPGVKRVWLPDAWLARYHAGVRAEYVLMGGHPGLNPEPHRVEPRVYDVAFPGYRDVYRRQVVLQQMAALGMTIAPNGWGQERHEALLRSSAYLQIHQWDQVSAMSPQRIAVAAAYSLPVIHETLADCGAFGYSHMLTSDYAHLADFADMWTRRYDPRGLENYGRALFQFLCVEHTFKAQIEAHV